MLTKIEALKELRTWDHLFISEKGVHRVTEPFGFKGRTYVARSEPSEPKGLTLNDGLPSARGQDAANIAEQIADHLGLKYPPMFGRGSRLRVACDAIERELTGKVES